MMKGYTSQVELDRLLELLLLVALAVEEQHEKLFKFKVLLV